MSNTTDSKHTATLPTVEVLPPKVRDANLQKQAMLRAAGYDIPLDGSMDLYQQGLWQELTTHPKQYDTTFMGLLSGLHDNATGSNTYQSNPLNPGSIQTYNPDNIDWSKTRSSQSKVVRAMDGTWGPLVMAAMAAPSFISAPVATTVSAIGAGLGGYAADKASKAITGRDIATNVAMHTPLTLGLGEILNPGYTIGGGTVPRAFTLGDAFMTSLTGKSRGFMKPLVRKYLGEPYYDNIDPSGYINSRSDRNVEIRSMIKEFATPIFFRKNVSNPDYKPKWMRDRDNPTVFEMFRNDAHRLSMGLEPHKEILADGKSHSLYVEKPNGKYDVDWDYIHHIKQNYSDADNMVKSIMPTDFPTEVRYIEGTNPSNGNVVANDLITMNGGFGTYNFNPNKVYHITPHDAMIDKHPTHISTGDVTFTDTWDVQPLLDMRSVKPRWSKWLTKMENKDLPVLSKVAKNFKEMELVDALGGHPFTQETILPEQYIYWFPPKMTLKERFAKGIKNKQPINIFKW